MTDFQKMYSHQVARKLPVEGRYAAAVAWTVNLLLEPLPDAEAILKNFKTVSSLKAFPSRNSNYCPTRSRLGVPSRNFELIPAICHYSSQGLRLVI